MPEDFVKISGFLNVLAGAMLIVYWLAFALLLPYRELTTSPSLLVSNRRWTMINLVGVLGATLGLLGQAGIYVDQTAAVGWSGTIGYFVASAGTVLLLGTMLWESFLWPILVNYDSSLLDFSGPI